MKSSNGKKRNIKRKQRIRRRNRRIFISIIILVLIGAGFLLFKLMNSGKTVKIEVGDKIPEISEFLGKEDKDAEFITNVENIDTTKVGKHKIEIKIGIIKESVNLIIADTTAPEVKLKNLQAYNGENIEADKFIEEVIDMSETTAKFKKTPDFNKEGEQVIEIVVTDKYGNKVVESCTLNMIIDKEPPTITGLTNKVVYLGDTLSYKQGVVVEDDLDDNPKLEIDNKAVNLNKIGEYSVKYIATDNNGNITEEVISVKVVEKPAANTDLEQLDRMTQEVLSSIIVDGMTDLEKARAIHVWVKEHVVYINHSDKESYIQGAFEGLANRKGDCYVSFATAKHLLTTVGIENIDVVASNKGHYWNLINCGDGWYHFDTTVFKEDVDIFMWTDEQIRQLTITGRRLHDWDESTTPRTPNN